MKKATRYLRFSSDDQSQHSIDRQELVTSTWMHQHNIELIDTFKDEGYSAKTFDRPDIKQLFDFIKKNHHLIDYLVVSELTRFSRDAGEAITMVVKIQQTYSIRIVSAGRNMIYDTYDSNSYFMMGLEFLLGTTENIKRTSDINGGIYTAKAVKGKWIQGGPAPYGYKKDGAGDQRRLVVIEQEAAVIRYIYDEYLKQTPVYIIRENAIKMGLRHKGKYAIQQILKAPLYNSHQDVKNFNDKPGGRLPIKDLDPIIDNMTWHRVQEKISGPKQKKTLVDDLPLRGILRCHCGHRLTGAPSTNKIGKKYLYLKCKMSGHLNLSAVKAHQQLQEILQLLSLPGYMLDAIKEETGQQLMIKQQEKRVHLTAAKKDLAKIEEDIITVETKFLIEKTISAETYHRWHSQLTTKRVEVAAQVEKFSRDEAAAWWLISQEMEKLTDLRHLYNTIGTNDKQELLRQVFDDSLYYKSGTYRTPWIMETFSHNLLELKDRSLLIVDGAASQPADSLMKWR